MNELCKCLRISRPTAFQLIHDEDESMRLPSFRVGHQKILVNKEELVHWLHRTRRTDGKWREVRR